MNGLEAIAALLDGKKIRKVGGTNGDLDSRDARSYALGYFLDGKWEIVKEPATDEELIRFMRDAAKTDCSVLARQAYAFCANILERRSIK